MILHQLPYIKENVGEITAETWCSRQFPKCIAKNCSLRIAFPQCIPKRLQNALSNCVPELCSQNAFFHIISTTRQQNRWVTNNI